MDAETIGMYNDVIDIFVKITILIGGVWAIYELIQYRKLKQWIQLDIDAKIYKLTSPEKITSFTWDRNGDRNTICTQPHTHAVEILLNFKNKGFKRMRLFNIQVGVKTMPSQNDVQFSKNSGRINLKNLFRSGNIVPLFPIEGKAVEETSFYYIEPSVEQIISFSTLIREPHEFIQVYAKFSLEQKRIFPKKMVGDKGLSPHTVARIFKVA